MAPLLALDVVMEGSVAAARRRRGRLLLLDREDSLLCMPRLDSGDNDAIVCVCLVMQVAAVDTPGVF